MFLILIFLAYGFDFFEKNKAGYAYITLVVGAIQSLFLICFEVYMILNHNEFDYSDIRQYIINLEIGDVYTRNGIFWNIQLAGNGVIFVSLIIVSFVIKCIKKRLLLIALYSLGIVISGHVWYYIASILFFSWYLASCMQITKKNLLSISILSFLSGLVIIVWFQDELFLQLALKGEESWPIRVEQFAILINDMSDNLFSFIFGNGLGHIINVRTLYRDYSESYYFEFQWLYIVNQIGVLGFLIFILTHLSLAKVNLNKKIFVVYLFYLFSGILNPYLLDSVHVIYLMLFLSVSYIFVRNGCKKIHFSN
jgi:hypothetical protein